MTPGTTSRTASPAPCARPATPTLDAARPGARSTSPRRRPPSSDGAHLARRCGRRGRRGRRRCVAGRPRRWRYGDAGRHGPTPTASSPDTLDAWGLGPTRVVARRQRHRAAAPGHGSPRRPAAPTACGVGQPVVERPGGASVDHLPCTPPSRATACSSWTAAGRPRAFSPGDVAVRGGGAPERSWRDGTRPGQPVRVVAPSRADPSRPGSFQRVRGGRQRLRAHDGDSGSVAAGAAAVPLRHRRLARAERAALGQDAADAVEALGGTGEGRPDVHDGPHRPHPVTSEEAEGG